MHAETQAFLMTSCTARRWSPNAPTSRWI